MGWIPTPEQRAALIRARALAQVMRDGGTKWNAIADRLTADGYPTMNGAPWRYEMVQRLVRNPPPAAPSMDYTARHWRVQDRRGPARLLKCVHCAERGTDKQARDWACLHDRDGGDPQDYIPLCRKCHHAYDPTMGHHAPHTEETRAKLRASGRRRYGTDEREALARQNPGQPLPRVGANKHNSDKTQCPQEHEYTPANTYVDKRGYRYCIKCTRERTRLWRAEQRKKKETGEA